MQKTIRNIQAIILILCITVLLPGCMGFASRTFPDPERRRLNASSCPAGMMTIRTTATLNEARADTWRANQFMSGNMRSNVRAVLAELGCPPGARSSGGKGPVVHVNVRIEIFGAGILFPLFPLGRKEEIFLTLTSRRGSTDQSIVRKGDFELWVHPVLIFGAPFAKPYPAKTALIRDLTRSAFQEYAQSKATSEARVARWIREPYLNAHTTRVLP